MYLWGTYGTLPVGVVRVMGVAGGGGHEGSMPLSREHRCRNNSSLGVSVQFRGRLTTLIGILPPEER